MSSINSISHIPLFTVTSGNGQGLSETTIMRLLALGIDPETVEAETQAQVLIAQAEAAKNSSEQQQKQEHGGNLSEHNLMSEIKTLAQTVGVSVNDHESTDSALNKISIKIDEMAKDHFHKDKVQDYKAQLENLTQRVAKKDKAENNIFNTMNMVSISNKLILGL